jgi:opacity protein-like surface antigen
MKKLLATALSVFALAASSASAETAPSEVQDQAANAGWAIGLTILNDWPNEVSVIPRGNLQKFGQGDWRVTYDVTYSYNGGYGYGECAERISASRWGYTFLWSTCPPEWTPPNTQ